VNHRAVQRALFRMQLDPRFAARLRAAEPEALRSAGLGPDEAKLLAGADPVALSADRDARRRAQFLRNVAGEFALSLFAAADPGIAADFPASAEFHAAVSAEASLPLAFASYLTARTRRAAPPVRALVALELALARERRARRAALPLAPGEVALAPWAELLAAPAGTLDAAGALRAALDRGDPTPIGVWVSEREREHLLLRRAPEPAPFALAEVEVERLSPALARLLQRARTPLVPAAWAQRAGIARAELELAVAGLLAERLLVAG